LVEEREEEKEQVKRKRRGQGGKKPSKWDRASEALEGFWLFLTARWEPLARLRRSNYPSYSNNSALCSFSPTPFFLFFSVSINPLALWAWKFLESPGSVFHAFMLHTGNARTA
jgi:hypothetical protein